VVKISYLLRKEEPWIIEQLLQRSPLIIPVETYSYFLSRLKRIMLQVRDKKMQEDAIADVLLKAPIGFTVSKVFLWLLEKTNLPWI